MDARAGHSHQLECAERRPRAGVRASAMFHVGFLDPSIAQSHKTAATVQSSGLRSRRPQSLVDHRALSPDGPANTGSPSTRAERTG